MAQAGADGSAGVPSPLRTDLSEGR